MRTFDLGNGETVGIDVETFKTRWKNNGDKCGVIFKTARVSSGSGANLKSEAIGKLMDIPLYVYFNHGTKESKGYNVTYSFDKNTFALVPMGLGKSRQYIPYHKAAPEDKNAVLHKILNIVGESMTPDDLMYLPKAYKLNLVQEDSGISFGLLEGGNKAKSNTRNKEEIDFPEAAEEVVAKLAMLMFNGDVDGHGVDLDCQAYYEFAHLCESKQDIGTVRTDAKKLDFSKINFKSTEVITSDDLDSDDDGSDLV